MTTEKDKARVCATCGKLENEFCSNSFHLSNDKTAEEILVQHSPNPKGGYRGSWIINAMHEYSAQQLKEYKDVIRELLPLAERFTRSHINDDAWFQRKALVDRARKLLL